MLGGDELSCVAFSHTWLGLIGFGPGVSGLVTSSSATSSGRFFLPKPQLLARLARVLRAVAPAAEPAVTPTEGPNSGEALTVGGAAALLEGRGTW